MTTSEYHFRVYTVPGYAIGANSTPDAAGKRVSDTLKTKLTHCTTDDSQTLRIEIGGYDMHSLNVPPSVVLEPHHAETLLNTLNNDITATFTLDGHVYRMASPAPVVHTDDIDITFEPLTPSETPDTPGLSITIGDSPKKGGQVEFTPKQTQDFKAVLQQFILGNITDDTTGMNPLVVEEDGSYIDLDQE